MTFQTRIANAVLFLLLAYSIHPMCSHATEVENEAELSAHGPADIDGRVTEHGADEELVEAERGELPGYYLLTTKEILSRSGALGRSSRNIDVDLKDAIVKRLENTQEKLREQCRVPVLSTFVKPCLEGELFLKLRAHSDPSEMLPEKGFCFCLSAGALEPKFGEAEPALRPISQEHVLQRELRDMWQQAYEGSVWRDERGKPRDPYFVGRDSSDYWKKKVLDDYVRNAVGTLGEEHFVLSLFHNAWRLSRLTRSENDITLDQIQELSEQAIVQRFGKNHPRIAELKQAFKGFNAFIWEGVHDSVQPSQRHRQSSENVDKFFRDQHLESEAGSEADYPLLRQMQPLLELSQKMHGSAARLARRIDAEQALAIPEIEISDFVEPPSREMCQRNSALNSSRNCPCTSVGAKLPCNWLPDALGGDFRRAGLSFGRGVTYQFVDSGHLPQALKSKKIRAKRTGYSAPNNTPTGSDLAGFAALRRRGQDGVAHLGRGTLDSPITAAVSPSLARDRSVCPGDMIYDQTFGWLRVEGGCTGRHGDHRVDVWRGDASTQSLHTMVFDPKNSWDFEHFPGGLIDAEFALENPGPQ